MATRGRRGSSSRNCPPIPPSSESSNEEDEITEGDLAAKVAGVSFDSTETPSSRTRERERGEYSKLDSFAELQLARDIVKSGGIASTSYKDLELLLPDTYRGVAAELKQKCQSMISY